MATQQQLEEGIRRADAAGDAEAVKALGAELLRVRKAQTTFDGQTVDFDVPADATEAQIQQMSIDAIRKQNPNAQLPAAAQVGVTQAPTVGDAMGTTSFGDYMKGELTGRKPQSFGEMLGKSFQDAATNVSAGFYGGIDFLNNMNPVTMGLSGLSEAAGLGRAYDTNLAGAVRGLNPTAARAPSALLGELVGGALLPGPKGAPMPKFGFNALEKAAAQPVVSAAAKDVGAQSIIDAGKREGVRVMTSDVIPQQTFIGKGIAATGERIPLIGTGGARAAQNVQRQEAVKRLAEEFTDGSTQGALADDIAKDFAKTRGDLVEKLATRKKSVIEAAPGVAEATNTLKAIDEKIAELTARNTRTSRELVEELKALRPDFVGKTTSQLEAMRRDELSSIFKADRLAHIRDLGETTMRALYDPLRKDMGEHIKRTLGTEQFIKWKGANDRLAAMAGELDVASFRKALNNSQTTPEDAAKLIFSKKPSEVQRLYNSLSDAGRVKAQAAIVAKAVEGATVDDFVSPEKFKRAMDAMSDSTRIFFSEPDKARIDGLTRLIGATRRASEAAVMTNSGQQLVPAAIGAAFTQAPFSVAGLAGAARIYESAPMRDLLLKLGRSKPGTKAETDTLNKIAPILARMIPAANDDVGAALGASPGSLAAAEQETN